MSARCTPAWGMCSLPSGHRGPHYGYSKTIDAMLAEAKAEGAAEEREAILGPRCQTQECPDYDGMHPFHSPISEKRWNEVQATAKQAGAAEEREACARLVIERAATFGFPRDSSECQALCDAGAAIRTRARGEKP